MKTKLALSLLLVVLIFAYLSGVFGAALPSSHLVKSDALAQQHQAELKNNRYYIVIDYTKNIVSKRLWVWDRQTKKVVLNCRVSHALKTGLFYATTFSNEVGSELSCTGAFVTLGSYKSSFGKGIYQIGMRIKGLEKGKNDNVLQRNIVFHSGKGLYSEGCFMTTPKNNKKIIDITKNGCLVYVY